MSAELRQRGGSVGVEGEASVRVTSSAANNHTARRPRGSSGRAATTPVVVWICAFAVFFACLRLIDLGSEGTGNGSGNGNGNKNENSVSVERGGFPSWCDAVSHARQGLDPSLRVVVPCETMTPARSAIVCILTAGVPDGKSSRTVFSGSDYVRGAMALGASLRDHLPSSSVHRLLLVKEGFTLPESAAAKLEAVGWTLGTAPEIKVDAKYEPNFKRYKNVYPKLAAMGLEEYECVLLVDADTLVVGSIDDLMTCDTLKKNRDGEANGPSPVPPAFYRAAGALDYYHKSWYHFNTGSILWRTSASELTRVRALTRDPSFMKRFESDQIFLNAVYPYRTDRATNLKILAGESDPDRDWGDVAHLPWGYNAQTHLEYQMPKFWAKQRAEVRILHFTEKKGWQCPDNDGEAGRRPVTADPNASIDENNPPAKECKPRGDEGCACREGWRWHAYLAKANEIAKAAGIRDS